MVSRVIAGALDSPLVVLLEQDRADEGEHLGGRRGRQMGERHEGMRPLGAPAAGLEVRFGRRPDVDELGHSTGCAISRDWCASSMSNSAMACLDGARRAGRLYPAEMLALLGDRRDPLLAEQLVISSSTTSILLERLKVAADRLQLFRR
jgi:hypothetical protein